MERKAPIMDTAHPDLLQLPHCVGKVVRLVAGEWQPDPSQREQLVAHLTACSYCRTTLIALLSGEQEQEQRLNNPPEISIRDLLIKLVTIHHELEARDYEQIGAYAEAIVAERREEADKRFSTLAEHMKRCPSCRSTMEETLAFLKEAEETD